MYVEKHVISDKQCLTLYMRNQRHHCFNKYYFSTLPIGVAKHVFYLHFNATEIKPETCSTC